MVEETRSTRPRGYGRDKALEVARSILQGKLGIIEGARLLSMLAHDLVPDWAVDPDFVVFVALDSETDHLPVGAERQLWEATALVERDAIVSRIEADARREVGTACRNILRRFDAA
jgi:hypothetical protein